MFQVAFHTCTPQPQPKPALLVVVSDRDAFVDADYILDHNVDREWNQNWNPDRLVNSINPQSTTEDRMAAGLGESYVS